jgi:hypothetical protein
MSKRGPTKAEAILADAWQRVELWEQRVREAEAETATVKAMLIAHQESYQALEEALKTTKRKRNTNGTGQTE